jgi:DNA-binding Lrp family transcriptional regulator
MPVEVRNDDKDRQIIRALQRNSRMTTKIRREVSPSPSPCLRGEPLEQSGVSKGCQSADIDAEAYGLPVTVLFGSA